MNDVRCVAVIGAESTGKSTLCRALAQAMGGLTFTEPLRQWVEQHQRTPHAREQEQVLDKQRHAEQLARHQAQTLGQRWVLCDSAPVVTAAYSQYYFQDSSLTPQALAHHSRCYVATLFCTPNGIDWVADQGQRDSPTARTAVHDVLLRLVAELTKSHPLKVLAGDERSRLTQAQAWLMQIGKKQMRALPLGGSPVIGS